MKILSISDLHLEFVADNKTGLNTIVNSIQNPDGMADVLVLAGDISAYTDILIQAIKGWGNRFPHVVMVCGNHEFYGNKRENVIDVLKNLNNRISNFHFLENDLITINDQRFLGTTLWFKFDPMNQLYEKNMNDFFCIPGFNDWIYTLEEPNNRFLNDNLTPGDIVVTHHMPSQALVSNEYKVNTLNRFFVNDQTKLIGELLPKLWLYGHTHTSNDVALGDTRFVCNPRDYPGHKNREFDLNKLIEV